MKLGLIISAVFVALLVLVVVLQLTPSADPPTRESAPDRLRLITLDEQMPRLYSVTEPGQSSMDHYKAAADYFSRHRDDLQRRVPSDQHADALANFLIAAMKAAPPPEGFLDNQTPVAVGMGQNTGELPAVVAAVLKVVEDRYKRKELTERDQQTALAIFALGERAFTRNVLLGNRQFGLSLMIDGGGYLGAIALEQQGRTTDDLNAVGDAVSKVADAWAPKLRTVMTVKPHVGDLLQIAEHDADRTFRIAATLQLGVAKFTDGNPGNHRAIARYLASAKQSDDPLIAKAAEAADALTLEQFRTLR